MRSAWIEIMLLIVLYDLRLSRSMRSAWIEIYRHQMSGKKDTVALHAERVD